MGKNKQAGFYNGNDFLGFVIGIFAGGVIAALIVIYGVPWVWHLIKPWLHAVTA